MFRRVKGFCLLAFITMSLFLPIVIIHCSNINNDVRNEEAKAVKEGSRDNEIIPENQYPKESEKNRKKTVETNKEKNQREKKDSIQISKKNYNEIINGHGTGLISLSEEEKQKYKNSLFTSLSEEKMVSLPLAIDHSTKKWFPPIGNQDGEGSCVAWSTAYYIKTFQEAKEHDWNLTGATWEGGYDGYPSREYWDKIFSPDFVYHQINGGIDWGATYKDAMNLICSIGASTWETMPYNTSDSSSWPNETAWREAAKYRGQGGYQYLDLSSSIDALKDLVANGKLASISVDADQYSDLTANDVWTLDTYVDPSTNHANTVVGYNDSFQYTEEGMTRSGAFKIANSWGVGGWENKADGYLWISYEAMKQRVQEAYYYNDRIGYNPSLLSTFKMSHNNRSECKITVGIGYNSTDPLQTKRFAPFILRGGDHPFPTNPIVLDITEFESSLTKEMLIFLEVQDTGTTMVGTLESFSMERYYGNYNTTVTPDVVRFSPDPPKGTVHDESIYAYIYNILGAGWRYPQFSLQGTNYNPLTTSKSVSLELSLKLNITGEHIVTGDINGDGQLEIIGNDDDRIFALNRNGTLLWNTSLSDVSDVPNIILTDINGDNVSEVICGTVAIAYFSVGGTDKYIFRNYVLNGDGVPLRIFNKTVNLVSSDFPRPHGVPVGIFQNGSDKIVAITYSSGINNEPRGVSFYNFTDGNEVLHYAIGPDLRGVTVGGDVDGDGRIEFLPPTNATENGVSGSGTGDDTQTNDSYVYEIAINQYGNDIFTETIGNGTLHSSIADINADGTNTIIAFEGYPASASRSARVLHINGTGDLLAKFTTSKSEEWIGHCIVDVIGDQKKEIVCLTNNGSLYLLNSTLNVLQVRDFDYSYPKRGSFLTMSDINGDGELEILVLLPKGDISILSQNFNTVGFYGLHATFPVRRIKVSDVDMNGVNDIIAETTKHTYILSPEACPTIPIAISHPANNTNVSRITEIQIKWEDNNPDTGILYKNGSILQIWHSAGNLFYTWNTTGLANKTFKLTFWVNDTQGDENSTFIYVHVIDVIPPDIHINTPNNSSTVRNRVLYVNWSAHDEEGMKTFHYYVNDTIRGTIDKKEVNITLNKIGYCKITVKAVDQWGNSNTSTVYIYADIDLVSPEINAIHLYPSPVMANSSIHVEANISDNRSLAQVTLYWNLTGGDYSKIPLSSETSTLYTHTGEAPAYNTTVRICFVIRAIDESGNKKRSDIRKFKIYPSASQATFNIKNGRTFAGKQKVKIQSEQLWPIMEHVEFWLRGEGKATLIANKSKCQKGDYSIKWQTSNYPDGEYTLEAKIHTVSESLFTKTRQVHLDNSSPTVASMHFENIDEPKIHLQTIAQITDMTEIKNALFLYAFGGKTYSVQLRNTTKHTYSCRWQRPRQSKTLQWQIVTTDSLNNTAIAKHGEIQIEGYDLSVEIRHPKANETIYLGTLLKVEIHISTPYSFPKECIIALQTDGSTIKQISHTIQKSTTSFSIDTSTLEETTYRIKVKVSNPLPTSATATLLFHIKEKPLQKVVLENIQQLSYLLPLSIGIIGIIIIFTAFRKPKKNERKQK